ncbi:MAG: folate-binding protein YgfZ [Sideroxyarcus sp.]|nr:folate-binding protein YgfZ [Sideroxyarcus sp.]
MNQDWQDFLTTRGAHIENNVVQHFGDAAAERAAAEEGAILCDLSHFGVLRVSGEDAVSFLQNLLSNDIREVTASRAQLSSFNNAKGRMLASFLVWREGDDFLLQLPHALAEPIRKKLSMYVLRAKVKITDASDEMVCLGVAGTDAPALLQKHFAPLPQQPWEVAQSGEAVILCRGAQRYQIAATVERALALWPALQTAATAAGANCWDWLDIRAGIPFILPATQEAFVPQMVNFEVIGGVNFKKGCYPGQEVVARMHYLGKPKRRMYLARVMTDETIQAGDELFSAAHADQACGKVVHAARAAHGGFELLAVVQTDVVADFPVHLNALTGPRLEFEPMPYTLP